MQGALLAGSSLWLRGGAAATRLPPAGTMLVFDARFPAATAHARAQAARGAPVAGYAGDVTSLWRQRLDPAWRTGGLPVEGITTHEALLCLRLLAQSHDMRLAWQRPLAGVRARGASPALVHWRIEPRRPQGAGRTGNGTLHRSM